VFLRNEENGLIYARWGAFVREAIEGHAWDAFAVGTHYPRQVSMNLVAPDQRFRRSNLYEQLVEHVFISELLQEAWFGFGAAIEVLRSEIDSAGYDLVLDYGGIMRHVQLKTSSHEGRTAQQKVNIALASKPSGCVIWIVRHEDHSARRMTLSYRFFGSAPGHSLPDLGNFRIAKHTKGNAQGVKKDRPAIRVVPKGQFTVVDTTRELLQTLFGLG
jgi:hypothetical protein